MSEAISLNQDDPFEAAIQKIVQLNRFKRADYALDGSPWSNFEQTAALEPGAAQHVLCRGYTKQRHTQRQQPVASSAGTEAGARRA